MSPASAAPAPSGHRTAILVVATVAAILPLAFAAYLAIAAPGFLAPLSDPAVAIGGLAPLVLFLGVGVAVVVLVVAVALKARRAWLAVVIAAAWFVIGQLVVILGPAAALIAIGLSEGS